MPGLTRMGRSGRRTMWGRRFRPAPLPAPRLAFVLLLAGSTLVGLASPADAGGTGGGASAQGERIAARVYRHTGDVSKRTLVMILGGSEGGMTNPRAALPRALRAGGYDVATLATFNFRGLPRSGALVPLDGIVEKAGALRDRRARCLAFIGVSRGGEAALLLASLAPRTFDAAVAVAPPHVAGPAPGPNIVNRPAWTWKGRPVPFLPVRAVSLDGLRWLFSSGEARARANYAIKETSIRTQPRKEERARIRVDRIERPLLVLSATRDHVWPSRAMAGQIERLVRKGGKARLFEHRAFDSDHFLLDRPRAVRAIVDFLDTRLADRGAKCASRPRP